MSSDRQNSDIPYAEPAGEAGNQEVHSEECPHCNAPVPPRGDSCPNCGRTLQDESGAGFTSAVGSPVWLALVLVSVTTLLVGLSLYVFNREAPRQASSSSNRSTKGVTYRVEADGPVSVTFRNRDGNVTQRVNVSTPWTYPDDGASRSFEPKEEQYLQIAAQKTEWKKEGRILVQIIVNGDVWKQDRCSGKYCMVAQDGLYRDAVK